MNGGQKRFQCSFHLRMHRAREMAMHSMRSTRSLPVECAVRELANAEASSDGACGIKT